MRKGVSSILATVLIVIIVVALAGAFLVWSNRAFTSAAERGTEGSQRVTGATQEAVAILSMACTATPQISVKNVGTSSITTADLTVYKNDVLTSATWSAPTLATGATATTDSVTLTSGDTIKIVTKQGFTDSSRCP
ncbi:MAG: hypothetical protein HYS81_03470 [Candidatus Aenigmatarchaeota archaeon]|nr:MAG: hypothetical protein HYS81_03470 [Candidatus Aenigmarchaeota archaeon]